MLVFSSFLLKGRRTGYKGDKGAEIVCKGAKGLGTGYKRAKGAEMVFSPLPASPLRSFCLSACAFAFTVFLFLFPVRFGLLTGFSQFSQFSQFSSGSISHFTSKKPFISRYG